MHFTLAKQEFDLTAQDVVDAVRGRVPETIRDHWVDVDGVRWPVKQALALATGLEPTAFHSQTSRRVLADLGMTVGAESAETAATQAVYGDGVRTFALPRGWVRARQEVLDRALAATLEALAGDAATARLSSYYDPDSNYAGLLFSDADDNAEHTITAGDLWAVTTLSMKIEPRQARLVFDATSKRAGALLHAIPHDTALSDLEHAPGGSAATLERMDELQGIFRTLLATDEKNSNHWVFAAKLCARKRPHLFPVRDNAVCRYLAGHALKTGGIGSFRVDIQVMAYLITHPAVLHELTRLRDEIEVPVDEDLKLLDAALWTKAMWGATKAAAAQETP
ncbi:DUF6308 family protein [Nocardioides alkalitolerans]|uniref:DUF6308 family protein n=1 Tax=Nocardioides alkalitolerans TaxID=281714 RepID=UPI0004180EA2|nr:DUF6308 family protein [Nocardioides alkalitolerans]